MKWAVIVFFLMICAANAAQQPDPFDNLRAGMPKDVAALIERVALCNHWGGEEPYDAARRRYIEAQVTQLRCDKLDADESAIRSKYLGNDTVNRRLDKAHDLYL